MHRFSPSSADARDCTLRHYVMRRHPSPALEKPLLAAVDFLGLGCSFNSHDQVPSLVVRFEVDCKHI